MVPAIFLLTLEVLCGPHHLPFLDIDVFAVVVLVPLQLTNVDCIGGLQRRQGLAALNPEAQSTPRVGHRGHRLHRLLRLHFFLFLRLLRLHPAKPVLLTQQVAPTDVSTVLHALCPGALVI